jgi:hypothetical protein
VYYKDDGRMDYGYNSSEIRDIVDRLIHTTSTSLNNQRLNSGIFQTIQTPLWVAALIVIFAFVLGAMLRRGAQPRREEGGVNAAVEGRQAGGEPPVRGGVPAPSPVQRKKSLGGTGGSRADKLAQREAAELLGRR